MRGERERQAERRGVARDFNLLMGIFLFSSCLVVAVNLVIDLVYTALDPRVALR